MEGTFSAIVIVAKLCADSQMIVADGKCADGSPPHQVEMSMLNGDGLCPDWDCWDKVTSLFRIKQDDKITTDVPATTLDKEAIKLMWWQLQDVTTVNRKALEDLQNKVKQIPIGHPNTWEPTTQQFCSGHEPPAGAVKFKCDGLWSCDHGVWECHVPTEQRGEQK